MHACYMLHACARREAGSPECRTPDAAASADGFEGVEVREWPARRAGRGCGKMAAVESCVVKCAHVPRGIDNATADRAAEPRRQAELYRFRATDLLYYASSVSFFFADVATGEQRVSRIHAHTYATRARRGCPAIPHPG